MAKPAIDEIVAEIDLRIEKLQEAVRHLDTHLETGNRESLLNYAAEVQGVGRRDYDSIWREHYSLGEAASDIIKEQKTRQLPETKWTQGQYGFTGDIGQMPDHLLELPRPNNNCVWDRRKVEWLGEYITKSIALLSLLKNGLKQIEGIDQFNIWSDFVPYSIMHNSGQK